MDTAKIAVTIDRKLLQQLDAAVKAKRFPNRSRAIESVLRSQLNQLDRSELDKALYHVDPETEKAMAEEGMSYELEQWPPY